MKRRKLRLSQAIEGFLIEKAGQRLSPNTIMDYTNSLRKLQAYLNDDPPLDEIQPEEISRFLASLAEPQPRAGAVERAPRPLSKKTALNYHTGLSALWTWAVDSGVATRHIMREVPRPAPEQAAVVPLTEKDVKALLAACTQSKVYARPGKRACANAIPMALRNQAIIVLLLDTGMRASELCGLTIRDVDLKNRRVFVFGKGDKERMLPISANTARALWKYISADRKDVTGLDAPLFVSESGSPFNRLALLQLLARLGERAEVRDVHPHRFRHTFAINYLRNGGNIYGLQASLGHTTLDMVKKYLAIAEADVEAAHRTASPVEHWRLLER